MKKETNFIFFIDFNSEPNFREINAVTFACIFTEFTLGGIITRARPLLDQLFTVTRPTGRQISTFLILLLQAYFTVICHFDEIVIHRD